MGNLRGRHHHDTAGLLIGVATVILNMAVLNSGRIIPALHASQAWLFDGLLIIAAAHLRMLENIVGTVLLNLRSVRLQSILHAQHEGQFLVLHLQRTDTLRSRHFIFRDDHGDIVAVVAHMTVK